MPRFERCPPEVNDLAQGVIEQYEEASYERFIVARVKVDFVFAFADRDENTGLAINFALAKGGVQALGIAKIIGKKERALGFGDAQISLDGDWWENATDAERRALLDHELYHLKVKVTREGAIKTDDLHRPMLKMRKHDYEFGWFNVIAARHGAASGEQRQAKLMMDEAGQYYWPGIASLL